MLCPFRSSQSIKQYSKGDDTYDNFRTEFTHHQGVYFVEA